MLLRSPVPSHPNRFHPSSLFDAPRTGHRHGGLDLRAAPGEALEAPAAATVATIYFSPYGGGWIVELDHGAIPTLARPGRDGFTVTRHMHVAERDDGRPAALVAEGEAVTRGQPFALAGESGNASGVHDHYEVHVDGERIDPRQVTDEYAVNVHGLRLGWLERYPAGILPGPFSRLAQTFLGWHGFAVGVDGLMGPNTEAGIRAFQDRAGLTVDGIVGPTTWGALVPGAIR